MAKTNRVKKERRFTRRMQIKLMAVFAFVLFLLILIFLRIVYINVKSGKTYAKQVLSQGNYDSRVLASRRGEIRDANGRLLAYSEKVYNVVLDCKEVNKDESFIDPTISALNKVFNLKESELKKIITDDTTKDSQYQVLVKKVPETKKEEFEEYISTDASKELTDEERTNLRLVTGVWFEEEFVRQYPMGSLASNVVGFSNSIGDGIVGLESYYDSQLKGTNGRVFGYLNDKEEYQKKTIPPENGYTLQLTLDVNVQEICERYIKEFDEVYGDDEDDGTAKHGAKNIGVVVMDCNTGGVLGMATNSSYDLNDPQDLSAWYTESEIAAMSEEEYVDALNTMWHNFCVSDGFEPGSTFKPVTIASALECGAVDEGSGFTCDGGEFITDTFIRCDVYPGAHGSESLKDALTNSCNDALMQIGAAMRVSRFIEYQSLFNFGKLTGIDLPNEAVGAVYTRERMNEVELGTCSFGQGLTCTMVQEAAAICAVVNGGYYYQPHLVSKISDENGKVVKNSSNLLLKQVISGHVSDLLREYMENVVLEGTGKYAAVPGYRIGGKTGTAEKIDPETGQRADGKYLVSFIGAAPIENPQVVIYVIVDEANVPDQAHSTFAQEIFRKVATATLPYLGIYPTEEVSEEWLAMMGISEDDIALELVDTFQAYDSNGVLHQHARVEDGVVCDGDGNVIAGAHIDAETGKVYDAWENEVYEVQVKPQIDPKVDNPGMAAPPMIDSAELAGMSTTLWDGTAMGNE